MQRTAARRSRAAKPLSATRINRPSDNQRFVCRIAGRPQVVRVLCGLPLRRSIVPKAPEWSGTAGPHLAFHRLRRRNLGLLRPPPCGPGDRYDDHQRQSAQASGLDEVSFRRADGIPINAACVDPRPPAPFNCIINADHDRTRGGQALQHVKQAIAAPAHVCPGVPGSPPHDNGRSRDHRSAP
jgi:hypothetical protein